MRIYINARGERPAKKQETETTTTTTDRLEVILHSYKLQVIRRTAIDEGRRGGEGAEELPSIDCYQIIIIIWGTGSCCCVAGWLKDSFICLDERLLLDVDEEEEEVEQDAL